MPVCQVWKAKRVFVNKRGGGTGYAGIENPLFFKENTRMFYGDANPKMKELIEGIAKKGGIKIEKSNHFPPPLPLLPSLHLLPHSPPPPPFFPPSPSPSSFFSSFLMLLFLFLSPPFTPFPTPRFFSLSKITLNFV